MIRIRNRATADYRNYEFTTMRCPKNYDAEGK
jgi:hypothetical protein